MPIFQKPIRITAMALAAVIIGLGIFGIWGVWIFERGATEVALKSFGLIETGVGVVDAGVRRVNDLIATSRAEVQQASETITAVGTQAPANSAVITALNDRLEKRLTPHVAQIKQVLAPVRDAVGIVSNTVSLMNSFPTMVERDPGLSSLDETFDRLEELSADSSQLRETLRILAGAQKGDLTAETTAALHRLTQRIDTRLGQVQVNVQGLQAEISALQQRVHQRRSNLLFAFNLLALLSTLFLTWILYSQIVVIQHHRARTHRRNHTSSGDLVA